MDDRAGDRRGGSYGRPREVNLAFAVSHTTHKIAVGSGYSCFAGIQNTHVAPETGAAGGRAYNRLCLDEGFQKPFPHSLKIDRLRSRDNDEPDPRVYLPAL